MKNTTAHIGLIVLICLLSLVQSYAQSRKVPHKMAFADMELEITSGAREEIQKSVNSLTKNPKYFKIKVDRAQFYFPIIEKIFEQEHLPDDFKYLVLQESALISDAVSSSNAVGFWQFKKEAAVEVGMRVDHQVDERMNIVSATRGAAKYLKKNNFFFRNWWYTLLSYNLGRGGAQQYANIKYAGAKKMKVDKHTHWYVLKFLAHKVAFEGHTSPGATPGLVAHLHEDYGGMDLKKVAKEASTELDSIKLYNKWLKKGNVPEDKVYTVVVPKYSIDRLVAVANQMDSIPKAVVSQKIEPTPAPEASALSPTLTSFNDLSAIIVQKGNTIQDLARTGNVSPENFLKFNDLNEGDLPQIGQTYYLEEKHDTSKWDFHVYKAGQTLWTISQQYGIKLNALLALNNLAPNASLSVGKKLKLNNQHPLPQYPINANKKVEQNVDASPDNTDTVYHVVKKGETLYQIAQLHGVGISQLMGWNDLNDQQLNIGQKLIITPQKKTEYRAKILENSKNQEKTYMQHIVQPGDTLFKIAKQYGVEVSEIMHWNSKRAYDLKIGEYLKIVANP